MINKALSLEERFWAKVDKTESCWLWNSSRCRNGYGRFWSNGKPERAHRVAYIIAIGSIPDNLMLRHTCDNRQCVNPGHLIPGTAKDNAADMMERGRHPAQSQTHCKRGHELSGDNLLHRGKGRECKKCHTLIRNISRSKSKQKT